MIKKKIVCKGGIKTILGMSLVVSMGWIAGSSSSSGADENIPEWLRRVEYSFQLETDKRPTFYLQAVQPLHQADDNSDAVFIQPRVSMRGGRSTYNLGMGYRRLASENLLLGLNLFCDYQDMHRHGRLGFGFEALGEILEARVNSYFGGITEPHVVAEGESSKTIERVVDGGDIEFGAPLPYLPWLKAYGSAFWYDFKDFTDKYGWKTRLEARVNDYWRMEFYTWDDNKGDIEYGGRIRFNIAFNGLFDFRDAFKFSDEPYPQKDLSEQILIPVERNFDITVEKKIEANGLVVEAGRT
jgi:adhesin/invasin